MSDVLVYEVGFIRLTLGDGSTPDAGRQYAIEDYVVELLAGYPSGYVGHTRWARPGPGEVSQFGDDTYGLVGGRGEVFGGLTSDPLYASAQFNSSGGRCFANDGAR